MVRVFGAAKLLRVLARRWLGGLVDLEAVQVAVWSGELELLNVALSGARVERFLEVLGVRGRAVAARARRVAVSVPVSWRKGAARIVVDGAPSAPLGPGLRGGAALEALFAPDQLRLFRALSSAPPRLAPSLSSGSDVVLDEEMDAAQESLRARGRRGVLPAPRRVAGRGPRRRGRAARALRGLRRRARGARATTRPWAPGRRAEPRRADAAVEDASSDAAAARGRFASPSSATPSSASTRPSVRARRRRAELARARAAHRRLARPRGPPDAGAGRAAPPPPPATRPVFHADFATVGCRFTLPYEWERDRGAVVLGWDRSGTVDTTLGDPTLGSYADAEAFLESCLVAGEERGSDLRVASTLFSATCESAGFYVDGDGAADHDAPRRGGVGYRGQRYAFDDVFIDVRDERDLERDAARASSLIEGTGGGAFEYFARWRPSRTGRLPVGDPRARPSTAPSARPARTSIGRRPTA
ncbi:hypothetical protein SO694_00164049 [Aureococcus anophagefferens]|uniref:Uncharacterized protein n=1 Tax=Aureococcus anophagefferens TaxID=44056 RepID=A0ABR1G638_AURAN